MFTFVFVFSLDSCFFLVIEVPFSSAILNLWIRASRGSFGILVGIGSGIELNFDNIVV